MFKNESFVFGSACSAAIAQFAPRKNARDHGQKYGPQVRDAINGCYVDDVPMTAPTEEELVKTSRLHQTRQRCSSLEEL